MRKIIFILSLILLPLAPLFGQKGKEESLKEQALEDIEALSSKNYPYIEQFHQAVREKMSGNYSEAKKLFQACLAIKQDDDAVYYGLAEIAKAENNVAQALENFQKAYNIDKKNNAYLKELAYMHFERANFEQAEILFKEMCKREPRNADFRYGYSRILIYNKAYQLAIDELNTLQNQIGIVPELMIMKADLYSELKMFDKTEEMLLRLKREYPTDKEVLNNVIAFYEQRGEKEKAVKLIAELYDKNPNNGMAKFVLAKDYIEKEEFDNFIEIAPKILKNDQVNVEQKLFIFKKIKEIKAEKDPMVLDSAEVLYKDYPKDFIIATNYINLLILNGERKKGLEISRKATVDNPNNFNTWKMALTVASSYLEYETLYEIGNNAIELFPNIPIVYFAAAGGALNTGRTDEALQLLASGKIYLLDDLKKEALFTMRKGEVFFQTTQYKKGIVAFEKALSNNPEEQTIPIAYALALSKANIAVEVANELLNKIPSENKDRDFYLAKAYLALNANNLEEGINILETGINNEYNNAELLDLLGDFHFKNQSLAKAKEAWQLALASESQNKNLTKKINEEKLYAPKYY